MCRQDNEFQSIGCWLMVNERKHSALRNGDMKIVIPFLSTGSSRGLEDAISNDEGEFDDLEMVSTMACTVTQKVASELQPSLLCGKKLQITK